MMAVWKDLRRAFVKAVPMVEWTAAIMVGKLVAKMAVVKDEM